MTLTLWGAVLYGLPWLLLGVVGLALVLSVRDKRRSGYTAADVRRSVERTGMWSVHPLAPLGQALTQPEPEPATGRAGLDVPTPAPVVSDPGETVLLHRVDDDDAATVLLPQCAEGWNDPGSEPSAEPEPVAEPEESEPERTDDTGGPAAGNPIYNEALRAMRETGGDAAALVEAATGGQPAGIPPLDEAHDWDSDDDDPGPGSGGGGPLAAERELEVQAAALPVAALPSLPAAPRYSWPANPARWPAVEGVLPRFMSRGRAVELARQWRQLRRRGEVEVRRVADPAQRLMQQIRADLAARRAAEGRAPGAHRADGFRRRPVAA